LVDALSPLPTGKVANTQCRGEGRRGEGGGVPRVTRGSVPSISSRETRLSTPLVRMSCLVIDAALNDGPQTVALDDATTLGELRRLIRRLPGLPSCAGHFHVCHDGGLLQADRLPLLLTALTLTLPKHLS
jgi:hypothetical protein